MSASVKLYITIFNALALALYFFAIGLSDNDNTFRIRRKLFIYALIGSIVLNLILYLR
jgi:hypothetical protein